MEKSIITYYFVFFIAFLSLAHNSQARSIHRPKDPFFPEISVCWSDDDLTPLSGEPSSGGPFTPQQVSRLAFTPELLSKDAENHRPNETKQASGNGPDDDLKIYTLKNSHLEEYPTFKVFDEKHFYENILPEDALSFRNDPASSVEGATLNKLIETLFDEIDQKKKRYAHFTILKKKDFNRRQKCGLLIVKFKDYPFVLKLFLETPKTFTQPTCKGFDNRWFFAMGGGVTRHLTGLTRLKNLAFIKRHISEHPEYSKEFDLPRKWFWLPQHARWLSIHGKNIGGKDHITTKVPAAYGVIADAIDGEKQITLFDQKYTRKSLELCNYLDQRLDPHIQNFMVEKSSGKLLIIDTEHFPTIVGFKKKVYFNNYFSWYLYLAQKCTHDWFFRTKRDRREAQFEPSELALV